MKKNILSSEIHLVFKPSRILWWWIVLFSTVVLFCVWYCCERLSALLFTLLYGTTFALCQLRWVGMSYAQSIQSLRVDVYGIMTLTTYAGQVLKVEVMPDSIVHPYCIVLHFMASGTEKVRMPFLLQLTRFLLNTDRILILPDHAEKDMLRKLRIWLQWGQLYQL